MILRASVGSVCVTLVMAALMAMPPAGHAQTRRNDDDPAPPPSFGATAARIMTDAITFLNMDDYAGARTALAELRMDRLSPFERGRVEQILFSIEYNTGNFDAALEHLRQAIDSGGLNAQEVSNLRYQIAQLHIQQENYADGAAALEEWFETAQNPNSAAYYLLAIAYYQQDDLERALEPAEQAVELTDRPQEGWLTLLLGMYLQLERYDDSIPLLERLVMMEPENEDYWTRLAAIYQQVEDYEKALAVLQLAYTAGLLTDDSEIERLVDMLRFNEIPHRGARILEEALEEETIERDSDAYNKLADAWIQAREFDEAIPPLERAAELSDNGDLYVRLGQVHVQREDWPSATTALRNALDKGDLDDEANAQLMMGIALFEQEQPQEAREWFQRVSRSDEVGDTARDWIALIDSRAAAR